MTMSRGFGSDNGAGRLRFGTAPGMGPIGDIIGWLVSQLWQRSAGKLRSAFLNGSPTGAALRALCEGDLDVAVFTPAAFARLAVRGIGPYADLAYPNLRAIAQLPHGDCLLLGVRSELGIRTMAQLRAERPPLRLTVGGDNRDCLTGFGAREALLASGISYADIRSWGGTIIEHDEPIDSLVDMTTNRADAVFTEAIMAPHWHELSEQGAISFLSMEPAALVQLDEEYGWRRREVPVGYFAGHHEPVVAMDYADWLIAATTALPDEIAEMLATIVVETPQIFERRYQSSPAGRGPITGAITLDYVSSTVIPLHDGAAEGYRAAGTAASSPDR